VNRLSPEDVQSSVVDIDSVTPHPSNPRQGDLGALAESFAAHGQYAPLIVQSSTSRIIAGNHRWLAAKQAGWERIAVVLLDVDDEQAVRIMLADNRTSDVASYADNELAQLLSEIADVDPSLFGTGWDTDSLDVLLETLEDDFMPHVLNVDDVPTDVLDRVRFRFGDYSGVVQRAVYDCFVNAYAAARDAGTPLLEEFLSEVFSE
jgi:ParB-like nuclease domain